MQIDLIGAEKRKVAPGKAISPNIAVKITGSDGQPLEEAVVIFTVVPQNDGAGATYPSGGLTDSVMTNGQGEAESGPLTALGSPGHFAVQVSASYPGQSGTLTVPVHIR